MAGLSSVHCRIYYLRPFFSILSANDVPTLAGAQGRVGDLYHTRMLSRYLERVKQAVRFRKANTFFPVEWEYRDLAFTAEISDRHIP